MRSLILFLAIVLMSVLVESASINPKRILTNRPTEHNVFKRYAQVKGAKQGVKGYNPDLNLRKGEFVCNNRICKLQPGVVPKNCNGVCQYPLNPFP